MFEDIGFFTGKKMAAQQITDVDWRVKKF